MKLFDQSQSLKPILLSCMKPFLNAASEVDAASAIMASEIEIEMSDITSLAVGEDGTLTAKDEFKARLQGSNLQSIVTVLDSKIGLAKAFKCLLGDEEHQLSEHVEHLLSGDLPFRLKVIPALWSMLALDRAVVKGKTYTGDAYKQYSKTRKELDSVLSVFRDRPMAGMAEAQTHFTVVATRFLQMKEGFLKSQLAALAGHMQSSCQSVDGLILDWKPALRRFDDRLVAEVVEMPQRATVVQTVKTLNAAISKWKEQSAMITGTINIKDLEAIHEKAVGVRDRCRMLIAVRTGLTLLRDKNTAAIANYYIESKKAHVMVPRRLRAQLDKLRAEAEGGAEEEGNEGEEVGGSELEQDEERDGSPVD